MPYPSHGFCDVLICGVGPIVVLCTTSTACVAFCENEAQP